MKRKLVAPLLFACAVVVAAASCRRSHSSEASSDTTNKGPSPPAEIKKETTKKAPSPPVEIKDPIIFMTVASSVDDKGRLVNPRFSFPQTEKQITAVMQLGEIKGSQLTVTWYQTSDDGDTKLFEHQIQVKSHDRAFSVAKNPGMFFSAGSYKVVATLDGQTKEMEFDIIPSKAAPKKTSDSRDERHFAAHTELANDPAASAETNSAGFFQAILYRSDSDESQMLKVASNESAQSGVAQSTNSTPAPGQPPVAGASGAVPQSVTAPWHAGPGGEDCGVFVGPVAGLAPTNPWIWADTVDVESTARCSSSFIQRSQIYPRYFVAASMNADSPQLLGQYNASTDVSAGATFYLDPCWLPGGSDLPGTKIHLTAFTDDEQVRSQKSADNYVTLGDDTLAPGVHVISTPARHSKVKPGGKINLKVTATDKKRKDGPWQTGVKMIQVTAIPGGQVGDPWVNSASPLSQKCAQKTEEQKYEATYTVPNSPPPIIELCAEAEDYAGNPSESCGEFVTGDWYGTLREHAQGNIYNDKVYVRFSFNEERDGTIKGTGRVNKMTSEPQLWGGCTCTRTLNLRPGEAEFPISGKRIGDEFQLDLPTDRRLTMNINCDCPPPRGSGTSEGRRSLGMSETFYHPKVKSKDSATNEFYKHGAMEVDTWIEIHRAK